MESDLWSLCATFYWVFKKRGPYYPKKRTNAEGENFEIMMNKWQCINYDKLTAKECGDLVLREIVNDTLTNKLEDRLEVKEMIEKLANSFDYQSNYDAKKDKRVNKKERITWEMVYKEDGKLDLNKILDYIPRR